MSDYKKIILKNSPTAGAVPLQQFLDHGELALNYADRKIYYKDLDGNIVVYETPNIDVNASPNSVVRRNLDGSGIFNGVISEGTESDIYGIYSTHSSAATAKLINTGVCTGAEISADAGFGAEISSLINTGAKIYSTSGDGAEIYSSSGTGARIYSLTSGIGAEIRSQTNSGAEIRSISGTGAEISSQTGLGLLITSDYGSGAEISIGGSSTDTIGLEINTTSGTGLEVNSLNSTGIFCGSTNGIGAEFYTENGEYHARFGHGNDVQGLGISAPNASIDWYKFGGGAITTVGKLQTSITANRTWTLPDASGTILLDSDLADGGFNINTENFTGDLGGEVTGKQNATVISTTAVTGKELTGYVSTTGTIKTADTILTAIGKLNGNKANAASPTFTGTVTLPAGSVSVAPLKLTSSVNLLTTPVLGSVEFDGDNLYLTTNSVSPSRQTITFINSPLTGYSSTTGTITTSDTFISAIGKLNGNIVAKADIASPTFTGTVTLPAGSASVAPLKLTSGTNLLTTPIAGSVEFDGTNLHLTNSSAARKTFAYIDSILSSTLTGYSSTTGTITTSDTVVGAIGKLNGNIAAKANIASPTFTGTVTLPTGSASVAPLKFVASASNLTTPLAGSVEFDGTNLHLTNSSAVRKTFAYIDSQLTGYSSTTGTISATDTAVSAIGKLNGNIATKANIASPTFTGTVTLPAGTTTVAPLKLTSSTNLLTTPVTGSIEFDGTNLYFTDSGATRRKLTDVPATLSSGNGKVITVNESIGTDTRTAGDKYSNTPFKTIGAAVTESAVGDLIYVRAGTYNINAGISLNTKGDLYFEPETTVTITSGTAFSAFSCSVNEDKKIYGYADFIVNNSTSLISLTASSPTIYFECNSITGATNSTLFTTAVSSTLNISIRGGGINTGSAKIFSLGGNSKISIDAGTIICNKYLSSDSGATSLINSTIQNLTTNNVISGIDITATGTANFYIDHYTHSGVGLSCAWQENATVEKIAFINTIWYTSDTSKNHISLDSTQASVSNKKIKLVGTNTFCGITNTTNCITSTKAVNIYVQNSYAATGAHANVSFKIGMFTVDTDVNNFN